jgi:CSLREA domain-containing protein
MRLLRSRIASGKRGIDLGDHAIGRTFRRAGFLAALAALMIALPAQSAVQAATIFTVNSTANGSDADTVNGTPHDGVCADVDGNCTLRAAIEEANANTGPDTIAFNIPGAGVHTITPMGSFAEAPLPPITDPVTIDGTSQPGYAGKPVIELDGSNLPSLTLFGLWLASPASGFGDSGGSTIRGLAINGFSGPAAAAVRIDSESNHIEGNYVGLNAAGIAKANSDGIFFTDGGSGNTIGGTTLAARNVISGNTAGGVVFASDAGTGNRVEGNFIGTNPAGTAAIPNGGGVAGPTGFVGGNTIGGTAAGAGNVISGNSGIGVQLNSTGEGDLVQGNLIGTSADGTAAIPNGRGVYVGNGTNNTIGGTTAAARNVISGNSQVGITISGFFATGNQVEGNFIGTNAAGTAALPNASGGVLLLGGGGGTTIGGTAAGASNVISGNGGAGVTVGLSGFLTGNYVQGNFIGTNATGTAAIPNTGPGVEVLVVGVGGGTTIGGTTAGAGNLIADNAGPGIRIDEESSNPIEGNSIYSNGGLGIDLVPPGVTPNDAGDTDTGANGLQNFPVIDQALSDGGTVTIDGSLDSNASSNGITYRLEFFANDACDQPSGFGEGKTFLGATSLTTQPDGTGSFSATFPIPAGAGSVITSTATDPAGNTSEFSGCGTTTAAGKIVVKKLTRPAGDPTSFTFSGDAAGSIGDGGTITVSDLAPGTYSSTEAVPAGWDLASISCNDGQSTSPSGGDLTSQTATFRLDPGETVTCTFSDSKRGTIVVKKQTQPSRAAGSFSFTGDAAGSIGDGGTITVPNLPTIGSSTYTSSEASTPGFDLTAIACDDTSSARVSSGELATGTATFRLDPGETVTCTFTNAQRGMAKVLKTVSGSPITALLPPNQQSFTFQLRSGASTTNAGTLLAQQDATVANGGVFTFATKLVAGSTYQLCEIVMPGWRTTLGPTPFVLYNPSGDNSTLCANFSVSPGETKSIAVNNRPPPGGVARTIGFWKNWASCASSNGNQKPVLDQTLAAADPAGISIGMLTLHTGDCLKAVRLLNKSTIDTGKKMSSDSAFSLAAQLLAAKLNVKAGALTCPSATSAINDGQTLLAAIHFNGITHDKLSPAQATQANSLATTLDDYNNNLLC